MQGSRFVSSSSGESESGAPMMALPRSAFETPLFSDPEVRQHGRSFVMSGVARARPASVRFVSLDSQFADPQPDGGGGGETGSYTFSLPDRLSRVKSLEVCGVEAPAMLLNVCALSDNNWGTLRLPGGGAHSVVVPDDNYAPASFVAAFATALNAVAGPLGLSFALQLQVSDGLQRLVVTCAGNCELAFAPALARMLGLGAAAALRFPATATAAFPVHFAGSKYFFVALEDFASTRRGGALAFCAPQLGRRELGVDVLARFTLDIPATAGAQTSGALYSARPWGGGLVSASREYGERGADIQRLRVQILNDGGHPVSFLGADFSLCLRVEIHDS